MSASSKSTSKRNPTTVVCMFGVRDRRDKKKANFVEKEGSRQRKHLEQRNRKKRLVLLKFIILIDRVGTKIGRR